MRGMTIRHAGIRESFPLVGIILVMLLARPALAYEGSSFDDIHRLVFAQPYAQLPLYEIDRNSFGRSGNHPDNQVLQAARRTLSLRDDLHDFPGERKLFQANGICFAGEWQILRPSGYTGQFREGTVTPVIARASVAFDDTRQGDKRTFGMAIKLFPAAHREIRAPTLNLFVMHSLGGVRIRHVLDLELDNAPRLDSLPPFSKIGTALRLQRDLERADREAGAADPAAAFRPVSHLAAEASAAPVAPTWVRLRAPDSLPRHNAEDFREELRTQHYPESRLVWEIDVASGERGDKKGAHWVTLGQLVLTESVTSSACDRRLHFAHPRLD